MNDFAYYKSLSRKRMGAIAIIFNQKGELLIVKPSYKERWLFPGGAVEENESPMSACMREVKEELGIELTHHNLQFLCVDYVPANAEKDENLQFVFYGGELSVESAIRVDGKEITEYRFVFFEEAVQLLGPGRSLAKRLPACLTALRKQRPAYLENGIDAP